VFVKRERIIVNASLIQIMFFSMLLNPRPLAVRPEELRSDPAFTEARAGA
jgi:hypothetical protein